MIQRQNLPRSLARSMKGSNQWRKQGPTRWHIDDRKNGGVSTYGSDLCLYCALGRIGIRETLAGDAGRGLNGAGGIEQCDYPVDWVLVKKNSGGTKVYNYFESQRPSNHVPSPDDNRGGGEVSRGPPQGDHLYRVLCGHPRTIFPCWRQRDHRSDERKSSGD